MSLESLLPDMTAESGHRELKLPRSVESSTKEVCRSCGKSRQ